MVLFTTLLITLLIAAVILIITILIGGSGFIIAFGDIIVCGAIIVWIIKKIFRK